MALIDPISKVVGESAPEQVQGLITDLRELSKTFKEVHESAKIIEFQPKGAKELRDLLTTMKQVNDVEVKLAKTTSELSLAVGEYKKIIDSTATSKAKLSALDSDEAKNAAALKVAIAEKNLALKTEAQALDESYQARLKAAEAQRTQIAQDKIEAQKLRESQVSAKDNLKELQALVRERERLANKSANSATNFQDRDMFLAEAAAARTTIEQLKEMELQMLQLHKETARQAAEAEKMSSAYMRLNGEHSKLYKQARDVGAAFGIESDQFKIAAKNANELDAKLKGIDEALGNHKRSVGQYSKSWDGLGVSMQAILREGPALAVSMNTFLLGISNNILPFLDELKAVRAAQVQAKIAAEEAALAAGALAVKEAEAAGMTNAEAKAQGKLAAARALATAEGLTAASVGQRLLKSFFSINTLLTVGVTLLTLFGGKLIEYITNAGGAEKATKNFNKALEESATNTGEEIGKLIKLQAALTGTTSRRDDVLAAMDEIKAGYPGYFNFLTEENRLTDEVSNAIAFQIDLLERKAEQQAGIAAINAASKDLVLTNQELNKEMGFFAKFWAARPWGVKPFDELTESAKRLILEQEALLKQGIISKDQYNVMYRRITEVSEAQKDLTEATKLALDPEQKKIEKVKEQIKETQRIIDHYKAVIEKWGPQMSGAAQREINDREALIQKLEKQKKGYEDARLAREKLDKPQGPQKTFIEAALQEAETRAKIAKDGSKEELEENRKVAGLKFAIAVGKLKEEYALKYKLRGEDLANNAQYQRDFAAARAEAYDEIEKLDAKNEKKNKPKRTRVSDFTNAEIKGQEDLNAATNDFATQRVETTMAANKAIYEDDKKSLEDRLTAYDEYVKGQLQLIVIQENGELNSIQIKLEKIAEIEKKSADKRTNQEKSLLLDKDALLLREKTLVEKYTLARQSVLSASLKEIGNIEKSNGQARLREIQQQIQQTKTVWQKWEADRLKDLNTSYKNREISSKEYFRRQREITRQADEQANAALVGWLQKQSEFIKNSSLPQDVKDMITAMLDAAIAEYSKPPAQGKQGKTIAEYLGFGKKDIEQQKQEIARQIEDLYNSIFSIIDAKRSAYYEKELNFLDKQQKDIEAAAAAEKAAIESTLMSQVEKDRALAQIDAQKLQREKEIETQRRALQREQAIREKQDAIFQASINAGVAIAKVFAGMGTGPGAVPLAIAQAALIAAQTAANIALISSRPIPEYWKGTGFHPGGDAIVGERGTELVRLQDGNTFLTPSRATRMELPRGAEVIPHHELVRAANEATSADLNRYMKDVVVLDSGNSGEVKEAIEKLAGRFDSSIKNLPIHNTHITEGGFIYGLKTANSLVEFLNQGRRWSSL